MINYRLVSYPSSDGGFTHLAVPVDADAGFDDNTAPIRGAYPEGTIVLDWSPNSTPTSAALALWEELGFPGRRALAEAGFGSGAAPVHREVIVAAYAALIAPTDL